MNRICTLTLMGALLGAVAPRLKTLSLPMPRRSTTGSRILSVKPPRKCQTRITHSKPAPMERTYGEIVAHIADVQIGIVR